MSVRMGPTPAPAPGPFTQSVMDVEEREEAVHLGLKHTGEGKKRIEFILKKKEHWQTSCYTAPQLEAEY